MFISAFHIFLCISVLNVLNIYPRLINDAIFKNVLKFYLYDL